MMFSILRSAVVGGVGIMATLLLVAPTVSVAKPSVKEPARDIPEVYAEANAALMRGDAKTWHALMPLSQDFVLMSPFGGTPSRYSDYTPEKLDRMSRFFRNGSHQQEIVQVFASGDLLVLAAIERDNVEVGGLPTQQWALRVTSVFKREGSEWKLTHRHADPFVEDVSLAEAARLARGERFTGAE